MPAFTIGPGIVGNLSGSDNSTSTPEAPDLNIAGKRKTALLMNALAIMGKISPNGRFTQHLYNELRDHLEADEKVDGVFDNIFDRVFSGSSSGSSSESSDTVSDVKDNLLEYFQGMMTNQGKENQLNREYNSAEALANREFQALEAQKQRDWYEAMSSSAYSRAMADMRNAGLNPILAYAQGGAASSGTGLPSSSAASYNSTGGDTMSSLLTAMADVIYAVSGASAQKVSTAFKMFRMAGG